MAPRSIWNGTLAFGEVLVPVKVFSVVQQHRIQFREVRLSDGSKIAHKRFGSESGAEVPSERIRKAYETSSGHQVLVTDEEIAAATGPNPKTIQLDQFVPSAQIDPIYYDRPYVLGAQSGGERAYRVLHDALERTGKAGIGRFVLRTREQLVALAPRGPALGLYTMRFADELVRASELELPSLTATPSGKELEMAQRLIDTMAAAWAPEAFEDRHRDAVMAVIRRKASGAEVALPAVPEPEPVADLLGVLAQSIERSGKGKAGKRRPPRRTTPAKPAAGKKAGTR